jgi:hypothetical protein
MQITLHESSGSKFILAYVDGHYLKSLKHGPLERKMALKQAH